MFESFILPPPPDFVDAEFNALFGDFTDRGGFSAPEVDEDWERMHRQAATCKHGLARRRCAACYKPPPAYAGWGS